MNHRVGWWCVLTAVALATGGCMENATLVQVNKDGSGTLTYRMYLSEQLTGMMEGMASTMAAMGESTGQPPPELDPLGEIKQSLQGQFGPNVTLVSTRDVTNPAGWKGVEAVYEFERISDIQLRQAEAAGPGPGGPMPEQVAAEYAFQFTAGDPATLKLVPAGGPASSDGDGAVEPDAAAPPAPPAVAPPTLEPELDDMLGGMGLQMMAPMLKGMRISMLISVDGEIVETNAKFRSEEHDNVVTLVDVVFDRLLNDPAGAELLQGGEDLDPRTLATLDIPGLRIEDPTKELVIRFK